MEVSFDSSLSDGGADVDGTYEATVVRQTVMADRVVWDEGYSFRGQPYRHLHHQKGVIGIFHVRLLEGRSLQRSHWSALALGPVKHFGLSKAHGPVSSYCTMQLECVATDYDTTATDDNRKASGVAAGGAASKRKAPPDSSPLLSSSSLKKSPVIPRNDNPVWDNCQLDFPFLKGSMAVDGMRIHLKLQVYEDSTAVETIILSPVGGGGGDSRMLGSGSLDITSLCLGETSQGQTLPGIMEAWIPISLPNQQSQSAASSFAEQSASSYDVNDPLAPPSTTTAVAGDALLLQQQQQQQHDPRRYYSQSTSNSSGGGGGGAATSCSSTTGRIRLLVSYEPTGMEPQKHDIVALECFARRHHLSASCRPILFPPLQPLQVMDRRGSYLLLATTNTTYSKKKKGGHRHRHCIRLHRNTVFVVERQNIVDAAHNWVLLPTDVLLSTPMGHAMEEFAGPLLLASKEMFMPALLSLKLVWMALRTTTLASFSGVQALSQTFWQEGSNSLLRSNNNNNNNPRHARRTDSNSSSRSTNSSSSSVVKLVQL